MDISMILIWFLYLGKINPLKSGQEEYFPITFQIPGDIEYGKYKFYVVVDPGRNTRDINIKNNRINAGGMVIITTPDDDSFVGCEACWKGYR